MTDAEFVFLGDALWLDFVNTHRLACRQLTDRLPDAAAYHRWRTAQQLRDDPDTITFDDVLRFRSALSATAAALHAGSRPPAAAIETINHRLAGSYGHPHLVRVGGAWRLELALDATPAALAAVARSAAESLADPLVLVRECAGSDCTLFFTDVSTTQGRHFCTSACGHGRPIERRRGLLR